MEAPEYYEHVRLRDVFMRDKQAVSAMLDHVNAVSRSLNFVAANKAVYEARSALEEASNSLTQLFIEYRTEADRHNVALGPGY